MNDTENIHSNLDEQENNNDNNQALKECQQELSGWKDRSLRISADFENYKKRTEREKEQWIRMAQSNILHDILEIADDFDRALAQAQAMSSTDALKTMIEGIELTKKSLDKLLAKYDVKEIKDMSQFNPELHEAVMQVQTSEKPAGLIVNVLQKGYLFKGSVLRPAKVAVAQ